MPLRKPSGKRVATGIVTCGTDILPFTTVSGSTINNLYVTVNGLAFVPSVISITKPNQTDFGVTYDKKRLSNIRIHLAHTQTNLSLVRDDIGGAYINGTGFRLPVSNSEYNATYNWTAYE